MQLAVLGATGRAGRAVVARALADGHRVTAIVRDPSEFTTESAGLVVRSGEVTDPESLTDLEGADAVVFAVGAPGRKTTVVRSSGISAVAEKMSEYGIKRIVALSSTAVSISPGATVLRKLSLRFVVQKIRRNPLLDMERMEDELRHSDLDWTVVRTSVLRDGPATGRCRSMLHGVRGPERPVRVADLAAHVLEQIGQGAALRSIVTLTGP